MRCHDPRISNDRSHKIETDNIALIEIERARVMFPSMEVNWDEAAEAADYCDWPVDIKTGRGLHGG